MDSGSVAIALISSSALTAVITYALTRPKTMAEARLADVTADDKTVQMALAFANAADQKAKDIEIKLKEFQTDFGKLQSKLSALSSDHIALLEYNAKCRAVILSLAPDHPILASMPVSSSM